MENRKIEKVTCLVIGLAVVCLSFCKPDDWHSVGIFPNCDLVNRLVYSFFHANILHATLNVWCLLSLVFIYDITIWRILLAYAVAITVPIGTMSNAIDCAMLPTVGISGVVYFLFGSISFEVLRKWYFQMWMLVYIGIGFLSTNTNAWLHLYCYIVGVTISLLNKPIKISK